MHFPNSQIHKELGHGPDAGDPKLAKVEILEAVPKIEFPLSEGFHPGTGE